MRSHSKTCKIPIHVLFKINSRLEIHPPNHDCVIYEQPLMNRFHKMTPSPRLYKLPSGEGSKDERKAGLTEEHFANNILTFATNYTETRYCCILLV